MDEKPNIQEYVENKIQKYVFYAKDFTKEDIEIVDSFCKEFYGDNRKVMILELIRYRMDNMAYNILNDKIDFIYQDLLNKLGKTEEEPKKASSWKGFGSQ